MKFQRNPTHARLLDLLASANHVAIDHAGCQAVGVDTDEQTLVESVRDELATVIGAGWHSPAGAEELSDASFLDEAAQRIGGLLRRLNARGLYLQAEQQSDSEIGAAQRDVHARDRGVGTSTVVLRAIRAEKAAA
jgi:hypothetical protein